MYVPIPSSEHAVHMLPFGAVYHTLILFVFLIRFDLFYIHFIACYVIYVLHIVRTVNHSCFSLRSGGELSHCQSYHFFTFIHDKQYIIILKLVKSMYTTDELLDFRFFCSVVCLTWEDAVYILLSFSKIISSRNFALKQNKNTL